MGISEFRTGGCPKASSSLLNIGIFDDFFGGLGLAILDAPSASMRYPVFLQMFSHVVQMRYVKARLHGRICRLAR